MKVRELIFALEQVGDHELEVLIDAGDDEFGIDDIEPSDGLADIWIIAKPLHH